MADGGHGGAHESSGHSDQGGGGEGFLGEIFSIIGPQGLAEGLGQELVGRPLTEIMTKDIVEGAGKDLSIGIVSAGGKPVKGGGGGGGAHGGAHN